MGLSASQARYLFISARMNDLEAGMLSLSAQQLRLKDQANDIEERRDYELNLLELQFNGNANFTYDDFMGENAINNGQLYFLTTNDGNDRVVLNQKYANAVKAAGIAEEGGNATLDAEVKFMSAVAGNPKSVRDWKNVVTGDLTDTSAYAPIDKFKSEYGIAAPQQGKDKNKPIKGSETSYSYSYKSSTDFAKLLGKANLDGGIGDNDSNKTVQTSQFNNKTWEDIAKGKQTILYLGRYGDGHKDSTSQKVYTQVSKLIKNLGQSAINAGMDSNAVNKAVNNVTKKYTSDINCIGKTHYINVVDAAEDKSGIYSGRKGGSHDRWYAVDLQPMFEMFYSELKSAMGTATKGNKAVNETSNTKDVVVDYESYTNSCGKTYEEWYSAWNQMVTENKLEDAKAKEYLTTGHVKVTPSDEDLQTFENYKQIFLKVCANGWTQDNDLGDTAKLSSKLENMQYKVNNEVIKNLKENFATVKANQEEIVKSRYNKALNEIERQEKTIDIEQTAKQTELNALQTELNSVQSMIDKNVERSFNLFG